MSVYPYNGKLSGLAAAPALASARADVAARASGSFADAFGEQVTPVTEDAAELRKRIVLEFLRQAPGNWFDCSEIANETCSTVNETSDALIALCKEGLAAYDVVHVRYCVPAPTRQQSGALVISGRLTAVGETFATIVTGTRTLADQLAGVSSQQVTLGINTDQARWLGRHVGGEVKLTVEVQL